MEEWTNLVANVGFPIAVTGYLLLRMETKMDKLSATIAQLTLAVDGFKREAAP